MSAYHASVKCPDTPRFFSKPLAAISSDDEDIPSLSPSQSGTSTPMSSANPSMENLSEYVAQASLRDVQSRVTAHWALELESFRDAGVAYYAQQSTASSHVPHQVSSMYSSGDLYDSGSYSSASSYGSDFMSSYGHYRSMSLYSDPDEGYGHGCGYAGAPTCGLGLDCGALPVSSQSLYNNDKKESIFEHIEHNPVHPVLLEQIKTPVDNDSDKDASVLVLNETYDYDGSEEDCADSDSDSDTDSADSDSSADKDDDEWLASFVKLERRPISCGLREEQRAALSMTKEMEQATFGKPLNVHTRVMNGIQSGLTEGAVPLREILLVCKTEVLRQSAARRLKSKARAQQSMMQSSLSSSSFVKLF